MHKFWFILGTIPGGIICDNSDLSELGITVHSGPRYKDYATEESRRRTFLNWPPSLPQKPDVLAEAGFFYAGKTWL